MKLWRVDDVMTADVVTVREDTPFRQVVDLLVGKRISAVPVVDRFGQVLGVVSEADLLHKVQTNGVPRPRVFETLRRRGERAKARGRTAGEVMTSPAVTVHRSLAVSAAARRMDAEDVKRLPVVDDLDHLVGIVTRSDLLKVHLRPDADIRGEVVEEVLRRVMSVADGSMAVYATDGVVTLSGKVERRSVAKLAVHLARQVAGVIDVVDELAYDLDDTRHVDTRTGMPFGVA